MSATQAASPRGRALGALLGVACLALSVEVVLLIRENRSLERRLEAARAAATDGGGQPEEGDELQSLRLVSMDDGSEAEVSFADSGRSLVFFYTNTCSRCGPMLPVWNGLVDELHGQDLRILPVRLDGYSEVGDGEPALTIQTFAIDPSGGMPFRRMRVPATLLIGDGGKIEAAWYGAIEESGLDRIRSWARTPTGT